MIELSDVWVCVEPRTESDLEEGPGGERAWAAKQAQLSAAELKQAARSASMPDGGPTTGTAAEDGAGAVEAKGLRWSLISHLLNLLLNRLQLTVRNVHIAVEVRVIATRGDVSMLINTLYRSS